MQAGDRSLDRLRAALSGAAAAEIPGLLAEARKEARARVLETLSDAFEESLIEQVHEQLRDEARPRSTAPSPSVGVEPAWYVYGVISASDLSGVSELSGLWEQEVKTVTEGQLAAVISHVPPDEFEESRLRAQLADMTWVEAVARAHEGLLDELCGRTTVVPMRMCTVYRQETGVREMLEREASVLHEALDYLDRKREWGVQAYFSGARAKDQPAGDSSGLGYMQRRREERELDEQLGQLVEQAADEIHESLDALTFASSLNPPQRSEASGRQGEMVLNGVYLVEDERQNLFEDEVRNLQAKVSSAGLELLITGPWPPYNFLPGSIGAAW